MTTPDPPQPPAPQPARRRFRPGRRGLVIGAVVLGVIVAVGIVAALLVPRGDGVGFGRHGGPGFGDDAGFGGGLDGPRDHRGWRDGRGGRGIDFRLGDDTLLSGTVVSTADGTLVITADGAAQRSLRTDSHTRVFGGDNRSLTDLTAGERVVVRVDGTGDAARVVAAWAPRARVVGTVTALTGDQATLVAVDGLTVTADLTGIGRKPAVGDLVVISGGANGSTLRADELRVLPKTP